MLNPDLGSYLSPSYIVTLKNNFLSRTLIFLSIYRCTHCCRPLIFQNMSFVRSNSLSLKYQRFTRQIAKKHGLENLNV